jgi:hypothetical protein
MVTASKEWFTAKEAAGYCGYNYFYFLELVQRGKIYHPPRNHRNYRFRKEWLDAFLLPPVVVAVPAKLKYLTVR